MTKKQVESRIVIMPGGTGFASGYTARAETHNRVSDGWELGVNSDTGAYYETVGADPLQAALQLARHLYDRVIELEERELGL